MMDGTLLGVRIRPTEEQPDRTQAMPVEALLLGSVGRRATGDSGGGPVRHGGRHEPGQTANMTLPRDGALWEAFAGQFAGLQAWLEGA